MGLEMNKVHVYQEGERGNVLISRNPYSRFIRQGSTPVICQRGVFYTDGGDRIPREDVPDWVWDQGAKMTDEGRAKVGFPDKSEPDLFDEPQEAPAQISGDAPGPPETLVDIIYALNGSDDSHWTKGGLPDLNVLKERTGRYVSRGEVKETAPGFRRST